MRGALLLLLLGTFLVLAPACGDDPAPPATTPDKPTPEPSKAEPEKAEPEKIEKAEPAKPDGALLRFRKRVQRLLDVCTTGTDEEAVADVKDLLLPDPEGWFRDTFGNDPVTKLVAEYRQWEQRIPQLPLEVLRNKRAGKTELLTERFEASDDEMATTFQAIALRKMETPTPLYSLRLVEPGQEDGWHVWSFVWHEGKVRFVGRLMALTPIAADEDLARRGSLRKKVERELRERLKQEIERANKNAK